MKKTKSRCTFFVCIYFVVLCLFIASLSLPETGNTSLFKEITTALFTLTCAALGTNIAILFFKTNRSSSAFLVLIFAGTLLCFGSEQTVNVTKDAIAGQQVISLEMCSAVENNDVMIASSRYELRGYTAMGSLYSFPLSSDEYQLMVRVMDAPEDTWNVRITGYLNCKRIVTFTAEKETILDSTEKIES